LSIHAKKIANLSQDFAVMPGANSSKLDLQYAADESENVQILAMNVQ
jgi:hypothetical protein